MTDMTQEFARKIIVALDIDDIEAMRQLVADLGEAVSFYKVGWRLFMKEHFRPLDILIEQDKRIFLDLKLGDIGTTLHHAIDNIPERYKKRIAFMTLQGNPEVARLGRASRDIKFLFVPRLSSDEMSDELLIERSGIALYSGASGLIASGAGVGLLRAQFKECLLVTPAIRAEDSPADEHRHILTARQAFKMGADYIVVGREILRSDHPLAAFHHLVRQCADGIN